MIHMDWRLGGAGSSGGISHQVKSEDKRQTPRGDSYSRVIATRSTLCPSVS